GTVVGNHRQSGQPPVVASAHRGCSGCGSNLCNTDGGRGRAPPRFHRDQCPEGRQSGCVAIRCGVMSITCPQHLECHYFWQLVSMLELNASVALPCSFLPC